MPAQFNIELTEEAKTTIERVRALPPEILRGMARAIDHENQLTVARIQQLYLSFPKDGPSVPIGCRVISNRLRGSIRASKSVISGQQVDSAIGSNVAYAAYQEFGFHGTENVRAYNRVGERFLTNGSRVGGRDEHGRYLASGGRAAASSQRGGAVGFETVKAHTRQVDYAGRGFVQRGLADRAGNYSESISDEIVTYFST